MGLFFLFILLFIIYPLKYYFGNKFIYSLIWIILLFICFFRNESNVYDYSGYKDLYDKILLEKYVLIEPSFILIVQISSSLIGGVSLLFFIYALISLIPKYFIFNKLSINPIQTSLLYISNFFILHDLTQIRISVAIVFFLMLIYHLDTISIFRFFILNLLGYFFHFSFSIYTLVFFFKNLTISKYFYLFLIFLGYFFYVLKISLFDSLLSFQTELLISEKANQYISLLDSTTVNLFNPIFLIRIIIFIFFLMRLEKFQKISKFSKLFLNYYFFGIIIYLFLWKYPAFAGRFSEMFFLLEVFIIPILLNQLKNNFLKDFIIYSYSLCVLILNIYYFNILSFNFEFN